MNPLEKHLKEVINPCWNFAQRAKTFEDELQNCILGLVGEAGELADNVKKMLYHTEKPAGTYRPKMLLESGDVGFYWVKFNDLMGFELDDILAENRKKLESRHPELGKVEERFAGDYIR